MQVNEVIFFQLVVELAILTENAPKRRHLRITAGGPEREALENLVSREQVWRVFGNYNPDIRDIAPANRL
ncbi:hypothetical protein D3C71_2095750 [compost metagenome]